MAIGDAVAVFLGTAATNYQPSSGVEVQISCTVKNDTNDAINLYDGSTTFGYLETNVQTNVIAADGESQNFSNYNTAIMITNALYLRKTGTSDRIYVGGVQTNA